MKSHAAVAAEMLGDRTLVDEVLADPQTSSLDARHKAIFHFVDRVNHESPSMTGEDAATARGAGCTDEDLYFAITVCALFNFYNRWIDASGVHALSDEAHAAGAKRSAIHGYIR